MCRSRSVPAGIDLERRVPAGIDEQSQTGVWMHGCAAADINVVYLTRYTAFERLID